MVTLQGFLTGKLNSLGSKTTKWSYNSKSYHDQAKITLLLPVFNRESETMFHRYVFNYARTLSLLTTATTSLFAGVSSRCTVNIKFVLLL